MAKQPPNGSGFVIVVYDWALGLFATYSAKAALRFRHRLGVFRSHPVAGPEIIPSPLFRRDFLVAMGAGTFVETFFAP